MTAAPKSTDVLIPVEGAMLAGELIVPETARGLVIFAHGSGSSRFSPRNQFVAQTLREHGMGTLLFDLLTPSEEVVDTYSRQYRFDIELLAHRLRHAVEWARIQAPAKNSKIGLFGASTGAAAALVAAAQLGSAVTAVVSRGGRPDLAGSMLGRVTAPVCLIVGGRDTEVIRLNEIAVARLKCEKALRIVPGASHLFEEPGTLDEVGRIASEWFQKYLGGAGSLREVRYADEISG